MPEVIISKIDVQKVAGRVTVAGRGDCDVDVYLPTDDTEPRAYAEVDLPEGGTIEVELDPTLASSGATRGLLEAAVRAALLKEE